MLIQSIEMNITQNAVLSKKTLYITILLNLFEKIKDYVEDIAIYVKENEETHTFFFDENKEISRTKSKENFCG